VRTSLKFIRYQCGLEDGKVFLRFSTLFSSGMTHSGGAGIGPLNDLGSGGPMSLTSPSASACGGVSMMTCLRCDGLLVREHLLTLREGSCPAFMGRGD